jgi:hypothetical protein
MPLLRAETTTGWDHSNTVPASSSGGGVFSILNARLGVCRMTSFVSQLMQKEK